jgi:hypothetical protein
MYYASFLARRAGGEQVFGLCRISGFRSLDYIY